MSKAEHTITQHRECMRVQHSHSRGPFFYDGCQRFVPAGALGTPEGATCATCACAKSYHRRVKVKVTVAAAAATTGDQGRTCTVTVRKGSQCRGGAIASAQQVGGSLGATPTPHPSPLREDQPKCCQIL